MDVNAKFVEMNCHGRVWVVHICDAYLENSSQYKVRTRSSCLAYTFKEQIRTEHIRIGGAESHIARQRFENAYVYEEQSVRCPLPCTQGSSEVTYCTSWHRSNGIEDAMQHYCNIKSISAIL